MRCTLYPAIHSISDLYVTKIKVQANTRIDSQTGMVDNTFERIFNSPVPDLIVRDSDVIFYHDWTRGSTSHKHRYQEPKESYQEIRGRFSLSARAKFELTPFSSYRDLHIFTWKQIMK